MAWRRRNNGGGEKLEGVMSYGQPPVGEENNQWRKLVNGGNGLAKRRMSKCTMLSMSYLESLWLSVKISVMKGITEISKAKKSKMKWHPSY
jgi:hypothetical protein